MSYKTTLIALIAFITLVYFGLFGCTTPTTPQQLQTLLTQNPEVLTNAIEANPLVFMEALQRTQQKASIAYAEREEQRAVEQREAEYANPKQPEIAADRAQRGKPDAPITIVTYSDFQCPYCVRGAQTLEQLRVGYCDQMRIIYKHLPLPFHPYAELAARYYEAVARQGSEPASLFHDLLFANQQRLNDEGVNYLVEAVNQLGLDLTKFQADLDAPRIDEILIADQAEAASFGFDGTPAFLINGISVSGAQPVEEFVKIIDKVSGGKIKPGHFPEAGAAVSDAEASCK